MEKGESQIGRPKGSTTTKKSLTIDDDVLARAEALLKNDKRSLSQFVSEAAALLLEHEEREEIRAKSSNSRSA